MGNAALEVKSSNRKLHTFEEVKELYYAYITDRADRDMVERAYLFALKKHEGQFRKSGEPYIHHLIEVCYILAQLNCSPTTLCAGLLHDVVEDTDTSLEDLKVFNDDVVTIVDALTKIQRLKLSHRDEEQFVAEDHRKIFLGMARDVRVIVIKLADRLHNMRTVDSLPEHRQKALARETMEVFAPIAHRLGINTIKSELEDLSIKYLEPEKFAFVSDYINKKIKNGQKSLENFSKRVADMLLEHNIPFEIEYRVKSLYSTYRKIYIKNHKPEEIFDLLAIRVITGTEVQCYEILGLISAVYSPIPGRFKDYIAVPKPNMYQSLHTCVLSGDGNTFEVQIRTKEMDEVAESGIAAHWRYKEGSNYNPKKEQKEIEEKLHWLKDLVNISEQDSADAKEYMKSISHDIFEANVYCFTPMGKVIDLPAGATPLDFAYKIHTGVAEKAVGAIVNNVMVPLNTELKTGDIVEIKTSKTSLGPNEGWLEVATTNFARAHIRKFLAKKNADFVREDKIAKGRQACVETFRGYGLPESDIEKYFNNEKVFENFGVNNLDELFIAITSKNPTPGAVIQFCGIKPVQTAPKTANPDLLVNDDCPVYVRGAGSIAINLGPCCTPIPGDDIIGYITKGKGITVHLKTCPNIANEKKRLIEVFWKPNLPKGNYPVDIKIEFNDRPNLLIDVMNCLAQKSIPVTSINANLHTNTMTTVIDATIYVENAEQLTNIFNVLKNLKGFIEIIRKVK